jgi:hypothetical protein
VVGRSSHVRVGIAVGIALGITALDVAGAQLVAEGVLQHGTAIHAVTPGGVLQDDAELGPVHRASAVRTDLAGGRVLLLGQVRGTAQGVVVLEEEDRDLGGRDRVLLDDDGGEVPATWTRCPLIA